jgi:hypothetical protein
LPGRALRREWQSGGKIGRVVRPLELVFQIREPLRKMSDLELRKFSRGLGISAYARNDTTTGRAFFRIAYHILRFSLDRIFPPNDTAVPDSGDVVAPGGPGRGC